MFTKQPYIGIDRLGAPEKVAKIYDIRELVASTAPASFAPTDPSRWKIYPRRNQGTQSSCVYHARAKCAGILMEQKTGEFVEYSATDYEKRSNKPHEGSSPLESMDMWRTQGIGLEPLEPSNNLSAEQLRAHQQTIFQKDIAKVSMLDGFYGLPAYSFELYISTVQATGKPIPVGFFATYDEWNRDVVEIRTPNLTLQEAPVRHEVCGTPNFGIFLNRVGMTAEDSWGTVGIEGTGVRWITREFFNARNYIPGLVPTSFKNYNDLGIDPQKPKIKLQRDLQYGSVGDDVRQLQEVYKYEGTFPANHSGSNFFGNLTVHCTQEFQKKYGIVSSGTPTTTGFGRVGPKTREEINRLYK